MTQPSSPKKPGLLEEKITRFENQDVPDNADGREQLYRLVVDLAQDYIYIISRDLRVEFINPAAARLFNSSPEILEGKFLDELFTEPDVSRMKQHLRAIFGSGKAGYFEDRYHNFPLGEAWMDSRFVPIRREGRVHNLLGISRDITAAKQAEETQQASEKRYRRLIERNLAGVFRCDLSGRVLMANEALARMAGIPSAAAFEGRNLLDMVADPADLERLIGKLKANGFLMGEEVATHRADGSPAWKLVNATLLQDGAEQAPLIEGTLIDITELKRSQEALQDTVRRLEGAMEGIIQAMVMTVECRDPHTAGHERRVCRLACATAERMELDAVRKKAVRMAAGIHDIGKITVPAEILSKPGKLTELEYRLVQAHAQVSHDILHRIEFPWPVAAIVLQHHERLDGSGYPQGLHGDAICLEARILAVADVVEAMTSHRPYRSSPGLEQALDEIRRNRGRLYDSAVVDACLALFQEKAFTFDPQ
jgi:PAS domain S-box-containing protein